MAYTVFRMAKLKTMGVVGGCGAHNLRQRETPNADPTRDNQILIGNASDHLPDVVQAKIGNQKVRKNAVLAVEMIMTASPEYFRPDHPEKAGTWDESRLRPWVAANMAWLNDRYGDRVVSAVLHLDEATPHIHAVMVPLDEKGKLNARGLFGGSRHTLSQLQTDYAKAVEDLSIERGIKGSRARHTTVREYYSRANEAFTPLPEVVTPPAKLRAEPEKPGWMSSREEKSAWELDHQSWEREKVVVARQKTQHDAEVKAQVSAALKLSKAHQAQAKEAEGLRKQIAKLKASNAHYVQKAAKFEVEAATLKGVVDLFTKEELAAAHERHKQKQAEKAQQAAEKRAQAEIAGEFQERVDGLQKLRNGAGAGYTFATMAEKAIKGAGGDPAKVNWAKIEGQLVQVAVVENGQTLASVEKVILAHSPGRADPATHQQVKDVLREKGPDLLAKQKEFKQPGRSKGPTAER